MKALRALLLLLLASPCTAAVIFDSSSGTSLDGSTYTSISTTHVVGSGSLRYIICGVQQRADLTSGTNITSVTVGGTSMTLIANAFKSFGSPATSVYGLVAPASGSQSVVATFTGANGTYPVLECISARNVDQTTPLGTAVTATADGTTSDQAVASAVGDLVVQFAFVNTNTWAASSGSTIPTNCSQGTFFGTNSYGYCVTKAGAASTTTLGVTGASNSLTRVGVALKADPSPPADPTLDGKFFL